MSESAPDRFEAARAVADAVLYEGYVLYPYRASSQKNQARFQWGVLTPQAFSAVDPSERWCLRTECLVDPGPRAALSVRLRFLQAQHRTIEALTGPRAFEAVPYLEIDGTLHAEWDEAIERTIDVPPLALAQGRELELQRPFSYAGGADDEQIHSQNGTPMGRFVRHREAVTGLAHIQVTRPDPQRSYLKVAVTVENTTIWSGGELHRDNAMGQSLIAVHTMLAVDDGRFVSLLDPPADAASAAATCRSDGAYPVLIGADDVVLASPIILYDHPEVAPQSPGDLYDSLEIDEILALRVMTLTDEEKAEARGTDARAAAIIDRCDDMSAEVLGRLHGQMREVAPLNAEERDDLEAVVPWWDPDVDASFDPWTESVWISGVEISKGSAVRLMPSHRADAHDIFLAGMSATVAGVFTDVDGDQHVAVTVDDDPATAELTWQGRYLFFHPDEVQPLVNQGQSR
jgi:hypothetical protein